MTKYKGYQEEDKARMTKLINEYRSDDKVLKTRAGNEIIQMMTKFIYKLLNKYCKSFVSEANKEDFLQAGYLGVTKALKEYNPQYSLTTFATCFILHEFKIMIESETNISCHYGNHITKVNKAKAKLEEMGMEQYSMQDLVDITGLSIKEISTAEDLIEKSMLKYFDDEDEASNILEISYDESPEKVYLAEEKKETYLNAIKKLSEEERICIVHKFGIFGIEKLSNAEICKRYNYSANKVRKAQKKAIDKLSQSNFLKTAFPEYLTSDKSINDYQTSVLENQTASDYVNDFLHDEDDMEDGYSILELD